MPYKIDLSVGEVADIYARLPGWARRELDQALVAAAENPGALPGVPLLPYSRILEFADGWGRCLLDVDDTANRIAVCQIQPLT